MNLLILIILLLGGTCLSYKMTNRDILSPWFLSNLGFLLVCSLAAIFYDELGGRDIHFLTLLVVSLSLCLFGIGEMFVRFNYSHKKTKDIAFSIYVPTFHVLLISFFMIVDIYFEYQYFMECGSLLGGTDLISNYGLVRAFYTNDLGRDFLPDKNALLTYSTHLSRAFGFFFIFSYLSNFIFANKKVAIYLIPIILCFVLYFFGTARSSFILLFVIFLFVFLALEKRKMGWNNYKKLVPYIRKTIFGILGFAIIFIILGFIRSSVDADKNSIVSFFCAYLASPIIGLDIFLTNTWSSCAPTEICSDYCGQTCLPYLVDFLNDIGFSMPVNNDYFAPPYSYPAGISNVYTSFYYTIRDFSMVGHFVNMLFQGLIYTFVLMHVKYGNIMKSSIWFLVAGLMYSSLASFAISDILYRLIAPSVVSQLLVAYFMFRFYGKSNVACFNTL